MRITSPLQTPPTATAAEPATLLVSFELSDGGWMLTLRQPGSPKLSRISVAARDTEKILHVLTTQRQQAERRTGRTVKIVSLYEAGRDGFWLHRWLLGPSGREPCGRSGLDPGPAAPAPGEDQPDRWGVVGGGAKPGHDTVELFDRMICALTP
jgi:hypothetical protein